jgi:hypothetical protein
MFCTPRKANINPLKGRAMLPNDRYCGLSHLKRRGSEEPLRGRLLGLLAVAGVDRYLLSGTP